jgi:hypothetical protein
MIERAKEQLVQLRRKMVEQAEIDFGVGSFRNVVFTCDDCNSAAKCEFTFDPYNTDGDCLNLK